VVTCVVPTLQPGIRYLLRASDGGGNLFIQTLPHLRNFRLTEFLKGQTCL
jgi:hypothetical protein